MSATRGQYYYQEIQYLPLDSVHLSNVSVSTTRGQFHYTEYQYIQLDVITTTKRPSICYKRSLRLSRDQHLPHKVSIIIKSPSYCHKRSVLLSRVPVSAAGGQYSIIKNTSISRIGQYYYQENQYLLLEDSNTIKSPSIYF